MAKPRSVFVCQGCGHQVPRWLGRCPECAEWNAFVEEAVIPPVVPEGAARGRVAFRLERALPRHLDHPLLVLAGALRLVGPEPHPPALETPRNHEGIAPDGRHEARELLRIGLGRIRADLGQGPAQRLTGGGREPSGGGGMVSA